MTPEQVEKKSSLKTRPSSFIKQFIQQRKWQHWLHLLLAHYLNAAANGAALRVDGVNGALDYLISSVARRK